MNLVVLPYRLRIAQLKKKDLQSCTHALLKIILFSNKEQFFSYTDTPSEISIVLEEETIKEFPNGILNLEQNVYRALELTSGTPESATSHLVHTIAGPLARAGISIFYISTYETDYTLIPEKDVRQAMNCLLENFPHLTCSNLFDFPEIPEEELHFHLDEDYSTIPQTYKKVSPVKKRKLSLCPNKLVLASTQKHNLHSIGTLIMKLLFFPEEMRLRFFSYCETNNTISMILPTEENEKIEEIFQQCLCSYNNQWQRMSIDEGPLGFEVTGIVDSIANPLAKVGINIFYVCTYETDHLLVQQSDVKKAIATLKNSSFIMNIQ